VPKTGFNIKFYVIMTVFKRVQQCLYLFSGTNLLKLNFFFVQDHSCKKGAVQNQEENHSLIIVCTDTGIVYSFV